MPKKKSYIINRIKSIKYALKGALILLRTEASIQVQFTIAILVTVAGFYFDISKIEWIMQSFAIGLVMGIEALNSAIEALSDFIHPQHHKKIGLIKDISAGSVFLAAIAAIVVGILIYYPKVFLYTT